MLNTTPTEAKRIRLHWNIGGWSAQFVNDLDVYRLFDTDTIPTAFDRNASTGEVVRRMQELNPDHIIEVIHG